MLHIWHVIIFLQLFLYHCHILTDDADHSGEIDNNEIAKMLRDIYGKEFESNAYAKKLQERIRKELGKEITVAEFREFVRKYPALLFPAFQLQDGIAKRVMGNEFWKVFSERRMTLSGGKFIEIGEFMALHTNKGAMDDVLGAHDHHETHNGVRQVDVHKEKIKEVIKKTGTIQNRMSSKAPAKGGNGSMQGAGGDDAQLGYTYTKDSCTVSGSMETSQPVASRFAAPTGKKRTYLCYCCVGMCACVRVSMCLCLTWSPLIVVLLMLHL